MKRLVAIIIIFLSMSSFAQTHSSDIMYKKEVTRALDLREPSNVSFLAQGSEITKLFIDAVLNKEIKAYSNDSLATHLTITEFKKRITLPEQGGMDDIDDFCCDEENEEGKNKQIVIEDEYYFAKDLYQMEIKEDLYFDKEKSVMKYKIKTITFYIPADHPDNIKGIQLPVASFNYDDCVKLFQNNQKAVWYNAANDQTHLNLADAFEMRLFSSYIIKVSNPNDAYIIDTYGQTESRIYSERENIQLMEYEHHLWEN